MRFQNLLFILVISIVFTGCGSCEESTPDVGNKTPIINSNNSSPTEVSESPVTNTNIDANQPTPIPDEEVVNKPKDRVVAETLKPVVDTFCAAMRNKDNNGLRKVFSQQSIKSLEKAMREERIATLHEYLQSEPVGDKCEVVNEEIKGNTATAMVITKTYPTGITFKFVKENNEWKMTNQSEELDRVDQN